MSALSLNKAAKIISNTCLLINSDKKNCFPVHWMASAHAFQEHILSGKETVAVYFFRLTKVKAEGASQLSQGPRFQFSECYCKENRKPKCTLNWSFIFEGVHAVGKPGLSRGLRQVGYKTTLQSGVFTEGYEPCQTCWTFPF